MSVSLPSASGLPGASYQGGAGLDRQRTVRFSEHPSGHMSSKQIQYTGSRPTAATQDGAGGSFPARSYGVSAAASHAPAASTVLRSHAPDEATASTAEAPRGQSSGDSVRGPRDGATPAYLGIPDLPQKSAPGVARTTPAAGPPQSQSMSAADKQQQEEQQQQQRHQGRRRVLEIEGTPSSLRRIADTTKPETSKMNKLANVAFIPPRCRSGSCPVFSRFCSRSGKQQFGLFGSIPGFAGTPHQQKKSARKQQAQPSLSSLCCFVPRISGMSSSRSSFQGIGGGYQELYQEVLRLREQNAILIKERDELLMENDAQRRTLATYAQERAQQVASVVSANSEVPNEHLEQLQALEEENTELRQQLAELGAALCTSAPVKESASSVNTILASQLRRAHADITKLRTIVRNQLRSAGLAQDGIGQAMKTIGKGGEVFASDPNDITVQEATLDSLLARGRRRVLAAREFVWSAVATLKDLIDQTFERMGRLVKSDVSVRQKSAYVLELHSLVTSQLDPALKVYNDLDGVHDELENLKAVVFDPKRNNPYCPCRPRRMVLEDDLEHVQRQLRETNEALRSVRKQLVKLEMENLANYIQEKCSPQPGVSPLSPEYHSPLMPPAAGATPPVPTQAAATPSAAPVSAAAGAADHQPIEAEPEESMEALLRRAQREHDAAKVEEALAALKDEVEMLKDRAMLEEVQRAQPAGYLAEELFSQGLAVAKLINQAVQATGKLAELVMKKGIDETAGQRLLVSAHNLEQVARDINAGRQPLEVAVKNATALLNSLNLDEITGSLDQEDRRLLQMVEEQAVKVRRINRVRSIAGYLFMRKLSMQSCINTNYFRI